jgi:transglutaminase-like putative cysteine protease
MPERHQDPSRHAPEARQVGAATALVTLGYLPLVQHIDWRVTALVLLLLGLRAASLRWPGARPGTAVLVLLALVSGALCLVAYQGVTGLMGGTALFSAMLALKLSETKTVRELRLVASLVAFLVVVQFLFDESIGRAVYLCGVALGAVALLVDLGGGMGGASWRRSARVAGRLSVQAVPLTLVLFLLFPRLSAPLWNLGIDSGVGVIGMSDSLELGSIGELVVNGELAFRVRFDGEPPPADQLYWRGPVLWRPGPRGWSPGVDADHRRPGDLAQTGDLVDYEVTLEPSGKLWVFALDVPILYPDDLSRGADLQLLAKAPITSTQRFRIRSALAYSTGALPEYQRRLGLELPPNVTPRMRALVERWRADSRDDWGLVETALRYFNREAFHYTLLPPRLGANPVDEFLFETRQGFCEHYASSFAVLMRVAGIPSRVVLGYLGGELNRIGGHYVVWQSDAHAWTEVWIPGRGWTRVDPTGAVDPGRVDNRGASRVLGGAVSVRFNLDADGNWAAALRRARLLADTVEAAWQDWVLGYSDEDQRSLMARLGLLGYGEVGLAVLMVLSGGVVLALVVFGLTRGERELLTRTELGYRRFCRRLERCGLPRGASEGPLDYGRRVSAARPDIEAQVIRYLTLYTRARYGPDPEAALQRQLELALEQVRPSRRRPDSGSPGRSAAAADEDHLPMQNVEKIRSRRSSGVTSPVISPKAR